MKKVSMISVIVLIAMAGCGGKKQTGNKDFITVDVSKSYSLKKELILQDFMDVEYIALETDEGFINPCFVQDISKNFLLVNNPDDDGDIFVFDRTGRAIRKINHQGRGNEEYSNIVGITLDEENSEMYVNNHLARKILVYDLFGNFKRCLKQEEGEGTFYTDIINYDSDHLIGFAKTNKKGEFVIISKQDGSITQRIKFPFSEKNFDGIDDENPGFFRQIVAYNGNWLLSEYSSDTVYTFMPDDMLRPFIVRTPSIQSMNPEIFLILRFFSNRYYFMETFYNDYDYDSEKTGFPTTHLLYDKQAKTFCEYNVYHGDFSIKKEIDWSSLRYVNHEIVSWQPLEAVRLVEYYKKGELKGKLKEIAATLSEESNPVIMLIKHQK